MDNVLQKSDEKTCFKALELLTPDLYAPNCSPDDTNALHITASYGYTSVVKEILARGFHRLLDNPGYPPIELNDFYDELRPASLAVKATHFVTARELLQAMDPEYVQITIVTVVILNVVLIIRMSDSSTIIMMITFAISLFLIGMPRCFASLVVIKESQR